MNSIKLHSHNQETYENIIKLWSEGNNKVAVIQATGTGKSYLIGKVAHDFSNKNILVLAPKTHILNELEKLLGSSGNYKFLTYYKLHLMSKEDIESLKPDLIILDEFHRCGSKAWNASINELLEIYKNSKVLGTTATNIRYLDNHRDMATEIFDDCIACNIDLADAVNQGILPMPIYVTSLYTLDEEIEKIKTKMNDKDTEEYITVTDKLEGFKNWHTTEGVPNILKKYIDKSNNKFIVFCKNKEHLNMAQKTVVNWFKNANIKEDIKSYSITYENGNKINEEILNRFKNGDSDSIHLLFSIDILNEGFHLDSVGVILLRETVSPTLFLQQIGRALTVGNSNKPLIFDFVNNFSSLRGYMFLNALKQSKNKLMSQNSSNIEHIDFTIYDESKYFKEVLSTISDSIADNWDIKFDELVQYYKENNTTIIPRKDKSLSILYKWCSKQRILYNKDLLTDYQIEKLNSINFIWDAIEEKWMNNYLDLADYYNTYGHTKVPRSYNKVLYTWCTTQRFNKDKLSTKQIELLDELNFRWNVLEDEFEERIEWLIEYKEEHGDLLIPRRYPKNPKLANWVYRIRNPKDKALLSEDRIDRLNKLGFIWDVEDYNWNLKFNELSEYYKEINYKGGRVSSYPNSKLSSWVSRQRVSFKEGKLSNERIEKLLSINFVFKFD